jgi:hypothetical protein
MTLSNRSVGLLVDLVENKITSMKISDREDARDHAGLQNALAELSMLLHGPMTAAAAGMRSPEMRRRGRPPKVRELAC